MTPFIAKTSECRIVVLKQQKIIELPYYVKACFRPEVIGFLTMQYAKYNFVVIDCVSTHATWLQPTLNDLD